MAFPIQSVAFRDPYQLSAFGELRSSQPYTLIDLISQYGRSTSRTASSVANGGTVADVTAQSAFRLAVTAAAASAARVRTNEWFRYQSGRGQRISLSLYHSDVGKANQTRNWGYFDDEDGLGFRLTGTTLSVFRRSSTSGAPVETVVSQAQWNGDRMDGTTQSGLVLDITKGNIYEIQFQWLGVGVVRFFINGVLVHEMSHPNLLAVPYMKTADLPLTWEVINTGASEVASMTVVCGNVTVESGEEPPLFTHSHVVGPVSTTDANEKPVFSIRLASLINGVDNREIVLPDALAVDNSATVAQSTAIIIVRQNATLTNATFASAHGGESGVEIDTAATAVSGGEVVARFAVPITDSRTLDFSRYFRRNAKKLLRNAYTGVSDTLTISVQRQTAQNTTVSVTLVWNEVL